MAEHQLFLISIQIENVNNSSAEFQLKFTS